MGKIAIEVGCGPDGKECFTQESNCIMCKVTYNPATDTAKAFCKLRLFVLMEIKRDGDGEFPCPRPDACKELEREARPRKICEYRKNCTLKSCHHRTKHVHVRACQWCEVKYKRTCVKVKQ